MSDSYAEARHRMVETQLRRRSIHDARVLEAFERVPRHLFVPEQTRYAAYEDMPLPIGYEQTISQPYIVGLMISLLGLEGSERVLEIGTGSGYQAALLGQLAVEVHTVELIPELGEAAARLIGELGYANVHVHIADGTLGWSEAAPYPAIIGAAAAPKVPSPLLQQLADGGRLVLPVAEGGQQLLKLIRRNGDVYEQEDMVPVAFVPMRGKHGWR